MDDSSSIETQGETVSQFLDFLDSDIEAFPENLTPLTTQTFNQIALLTKGLNVHLDAPLSSKDD